MPPLPSGVPSRIYPATQQVDPSTTQPDMAKDGYTLISILFDEELNWGFVAGNSVASTQIFAYMPAIITNALGITSLFLSLFGIFIDGVFFSS